MTKNSAQGVAVCVLLCAGIATIALRESGHIGESVASVVFVMLMTTAVASHFLIRRRYGDSTQ